MDLEWQLDLHPVIFLVCLPFSFDFTIVCNEMEALRVVLTECDRCVDSDNCLLLVLLREEKLECWIRFRFVLGD